jgi:uncharacterized cupredoxin-like copper-binding protein
MKILRVCAVALAVLLLAGACGGGDGDAEGDDAAAEAIAAPDYDEFCEGVVRAEAGVLAAASGGDPGDIEGLIATVEETAPEELQEQVAVIIAGVNEALETKDDAPFETEEFSTNDEEVDLWVADNCGWDSVHVAAVEYAFEEVPETLPAGFTTFHFANEGEEMHEMLMVRYKDESLTIDDLIKLSEKDAQEKIDFLGASFGPPGATDSETKELTPGKYALICFVPVGSTSEEAAEKADGPPHVAKGMSAEFTVE